jgi:hypothetical protein
MRLLLLALMALLLPQAAAAEERILDFDSKVAIQPDGAIDVTKRSTSMSRMSRSTWHLS